LKTQGFRNKFKLIRRIATLFQGHRSALILAIWSVLGRTLLMVALPLIFREIIDRGILSKEVSLLLVLAGAYFIMTLLQGILEYFQSLLVGYMGISIVNDLKQKLLKQVLSLSIRFFDQTKSGKLISRIESDSQQLYMLFSQVGLQLFWAFLNIGISLTIMWMTSVTLTLYVLSLAPLFLLGTYLIFGRIRKMFKQDRANASEISGFLGEHLPSIPLLRNLNNLPWSHDRFRKVNHTKRDYSIKINVIEAIIWFMMMVAPLLAITIVLYQGIHWVHAGEMSIGTMYMFVQYIQAVIGPLILISEQLSEVQKALGAAERIFELWDTPPEIQEHPQASVLTPFQHSIRFENVSFAYDPEKPVLQNLSFEIRKGTRVAIVGATGSGKSTTIALLARFYDPIQGRITKDGQDIREFRSKEWLAQMSFVPQDLFLFPDTIEENLKALRSDITKEEVYHAAQQLGVEAFIQKFPQGYQTLLAEQGKNLSFGERQLLSFARALTFDPEILVIDEATSSVDPQTEQNIQESLNRLLQGRTAVIIAHRLSTIIRADKILVFHQGKLIEEGNHQELVEKDGHYGMLYRLQSQEEKHAHVF
jgi:ATP-binding cassette subfamily B multidrug efflux pump